LEVHQADEEWQQSVWGRAGEACTVREGLATKEMPGEPTGAWRKPVLAG